MNNRHYMMQVGPFEDLSTPSELSWRPYGNSITTLSPSSLRCSSKNEAANLNASIQQQQQQEQESHSYDNWEEETATKKKKFLEKQTLPFGEFLAVSHRPQSHFLPSSPQYYKHDQHFPCAAQPQMLQPHLHSTSSFAHQIHLHGWGGASLGQKNEFGDELLQELVWSIHIIALCGDDMQPI